MARFSKASEKNYMEEQKQGENGLKLQVKMNLKRAEKCCENTTFENIFKNLLKIHSKCIVHGYTFIFEFNHMVTLFRPSVVIIPQSRKNLELGHENR